MKKTFFTIILQLIIFSCGYTQNIGIGTTTPNPSAILDVKSNIQGMLLPRTSTTSRNAISNPAKGLILYDTTTSGFWFHNGASWTQLSTGIATNYWSVNSGGDIYNNTAGFIGIGTATPVYKFSVQTQTNQVGLSHTDGTVTLASYIGSFQGALGGWFGTRSNHPLYFFTNNSAQQMTIMPGGNVGIGTINPMNKLQIGTVQGFTNYDLGIGNGSQAMVFQQNSGFANWQSNTNITLLPTNATGNVGINTVSPNNKLQIGNAGSFNGNDVAMGNGTNALGIAQTNTAAQFASSTDFVFLPRFGSTGRVGINTSTPKAPLDVEGFTSFDINLSGSPYHAYYAVGTNSNFNAVAIYGATQSSDPVPVSIYAGQRVVGAEFDAFSDARIKNIIGNSDGIKDLNTIDALQIKNYTMKDKVKYGNKLYKKVIAQEVEKVYPQVVSKHTDFIPNVYQVTNKITRTANGYLLTFSANHKIDSNAKKLQLILAESGMQQFNIVAIPSATEVIINAIDIKGDKVFVYGEEVNDFRTVDYEGLTTLNISATQELSKLVKQQQAAIDAQNKIISGLAEEIKLLKDKGTIAKQ